ncbi:MAG: SRPBCC family protein [Solirubrobacteraceae bacterium]|jgi:uncharacterized protein YndB with AHSA1/START domain
MPVRREIEVEATPEDVWEALVDEDRRAEWLGEEGRQIDVEQIQAPSRLVWWWSEGEEPPTRVEVQIVGVPAGARVVVTETIPAFPLASLSACFALVAV